MDTVIYTLAIFCPVCLFLAVFFANRYQYAMEENTRLKAKIFTMSADALLDKLI